MWRRRQCSVSMKNTILLANSTLLEEFTLLSANNGSKFEELVAACAAHSSAELLLPGYRIKNNLARGAFATARGNDMMVFGPKVQLPPPAALTPDGTQLDLQQFAPNSTTNYTGSNGGFEYGWALSATAQYDGVHYPFTVGYFNLNDRTSAGGQAMVDLRDASAAAVRTYMADGTSSDLTDDFLLAAESTIGSVPMAVVSEVLSPAALAAAAKAHALTHVRVHNLTEVFSGANPVPPAGEPLIPQDGGLRWNDQYSGTSAFVSDGPLVDTWSTPVSLEPLRHKGSSWRTQAQSRRRPQ